MPLLRKWCSVWLSLMKCLHFICKPHRTLTEKLPKCLVYRGVSTHVFQSALCNPLCLMASIARKELASTSGLQSKLCYESCSTLKFKLKWHFRILSASSNWNSFMILLTIPWNCALWVSILMLETHLSFSVSPQMLRRGVPISVYVEGTCKRTRAC